MPCLRFPRPGLCFLLLDPLVLPVTGFCFVPPARRTLADGTALGWTVAATDCGALAGGGEGVASAGFAGDVSTPALLESAVEGAPR